MRLMKCRKHPKYLGVRRQRTVKCLYCRVLFTLLHRFSWLSLGKEASSAVEADPQ